MKHLMLRMVPAVFVLAGFCLIVVAREPASVVGKWKNPTMEGISFEFKEDKTGVMVAFGIDARFVWKQHDKVGTQRYPGDTILLQFPPEKDIHKTVLDKDGKKLHYFGKKDMVTPEFTLQRVK